MNPKLAWIIRQLQTPPDKLKRKIFRRLGVAGQQRVARWRGKWRSTHLQKTPSGSLAHCVKIPTPAALSETNPELGLLAPLYLEHRFDLLGSGWVKVSYRRKCAGFGGYRYQASCYSSTDAEGEWLVGRINKPNLPEAQRIWRLVDIGYVPIDWQLDFKSGYRWDESTWYLDIVVPDDAPGADIKVPWELARCQHVPQLALAYAGGACGMIEERERFVREFRNQVLDFLANNPPGYGVNWHCTMDVAIRITNWLIARDLFMAAGAIFDADFEALFLRSVMEHGRHIVGNVEWSESGRSNHYLSNVVGLLAVVVYLPRTDETDAWTGWALREFVLEVEEQFDASGCNREGSTSYHRLSAEMAIYGAAFACHLLNRSPDVAHAGMDRVPHLSGWGGRPRAVLARVVRDLTEGALPAWFWRRLHGMGKLVIALSKPDGTVPQIGDNDSGRFMRVGMNRKCLDHHHLLGALNTFFIDDVFSALGSDYRVEAEILHAIAGIDCQRSVDGPAMCRIGQAGDLRGYLSAFDRAPDTHRQRYEFALAGQGCLEKMSAEGFPEFGVFVLRGPGLYAAFRCGPAEQYGQGSHLHHDQLSLELVIDGESLVLDPGSYVYTPLPSSRNAYRSLHAHFTPWPANATHGSPDDGLFFFRNTYRGECLYFQSDGIVGRHFGFGGATYRIVTLDDNYLVVRDFSDAVTLDRCPFNGEPPRFQGLPFSDGYGRQL